MSNIPVMISSCLLGSAVRYNSTPNEMSPELSELLGQYAVQIAICPEVTGGLPVPREAAEIEGGDGGDVLKGSARVITASGMDVTRDFLRGAEKVLGTALAENVELAVLVERSPSCGSSMVYDGTFSRNRLSGAGVTTALLRCYGIEVFSQYQVTEIREWFQLRKNVR